jgi:hypothetical protein
MSICLCVSILVLVTMVFASINPQKTVRSYIIQKDFFDGGKAAEYSIYDPTKQELQYRMESRYAFFQGVDVIAYPSKEIVARLKKNFKLFLYKATISILDPRSKKWINGTIHQRSWRPYDIKWNGQFVQMMSYLESWDLITEFYNANGTNLLAKFDKKFLSLGKASLEIFSDELPHAIYFLGMAAKEYAERSRGKGKKK